MEIPTIVVLISGNGTNFQAIIDSIDKNIILGNIQCVISNKICKGIEIAKNNNIPVHTVIKNKNENREEYDIRLVNIIKPLKPNLIVLAGWMRILTNKFIKEFDKIINLHPALPNTFTGINCIEKAFNAFRLKRINYTGIMVHNVIEKVDGGEVIAMCKVPIYLNDTLKKLSLRMQQIEKSVLIEGIQICISNIINDRKFQKK